MILLPACWGLQLPNEEHGMQCVCVSWRAAKLSRQLVLAVKGTAIQMLVGCFYHCLTYMLAVSALCICSVGGLLGKFPGAAAEAFESIDCPFPQIHSFNRQQAMHAAAA